MRTISEKIRDLAAKNTNEVTLPFSAELDTQVSHFLSDPFQKVLLMHGEAFCGKSQYCQKIFRDYAKNDTIIPVYLNISQIQNPIYELIKDGLTQQNLEADVIQFIIQNKQSPFLFIIDNCDERTIYYNLIATNRLNEWVYSKILIMTRTIYFIPQENSNIYYDYTPLYRSPCSRTIVNEIPAITENEIENLQNDPTLSTVLKSMPCLKLLVMVHRFFLREYQQQYPKNPFFNEFQWMQYLLKKWFAQEAHRIYVRQQAGTFSATQVLTIDKIQQACWQMSRQLASQMNQTSNKTLWCGGVSKQLGEIAEERPHPWESFFNIQKNPLAIYTLAGYLLTRKTTGHYVFLTPALLEYLKVQSIDVDDIYSFQQSINKSTNYSIIENIEGISSMNFEGKFFNQNLPTNQPDQGEKLAEGIMRGARDSEIIKNIVFELLHSTNEKSVEIAIMILKQFPHIFPPNNNFDQLWKNNLPISDKKYFESPHQSMTIKRSEKFAELRELLDRIEKYTQALLSLQSEKTKLRKDTVEYCSKVEQIETVKSIIDDSNKKYYMVLNYYTTHIKQTVEGTVTGTAKVEAFNMMNAPHNKTDSLIVDIENPELCIDQKVLKGGSAKKLITLFNNPFFNSHDQETSISHSELNLTSNNNNNVIQANASAPSRSNLFSPSPINTPLFVMKADNLLKEMLENEIYCKNEYLGPSLGELQEQIEFCKKTGFNQVSKQQRDAIRDTVETIYLIKEQIDQSKKNSTELVASPASIFLPGSVSNTQAHVVNEGSINRVEQKIGCNIFELYVGQIRSGTSSILDEVIKKTLNTESLYQLERQVTLDELTEDQWIIEQVKHYYKTQDTIELPMRVQSLSIAKITRLIDAQMSYPKNISTPSDINYESADQSYIEINEVYGSFAHNKSRNSHSQPFDSTESSKRILITGDFGIGKSTWCQIFCYQWSGTKLSNEHLFKRFHTILWIQLRRINELDLTPEQIIAKCCFAQTVHFEEASLHQKLKTYLARHRNEILFILDGYDETYPKIQKHESIQKLLTYFLEQKNWILITRPHTAPLHIRYDKKLENVGFSSQDIKDYVINFFKDDDEKSYVTKNSKAFIAMLENSKTLYELAHIPIILQLMCCFLSDNLVENNHTTTKTNLISITQLFVELVTKLLGRHLEQREDKKDAVDWDFGQIELEYKNEILFLEKLAWEELNQNNSLLDFKEEKTRKIFQEFKPESNKEYEQFIDRLKNCGIIKTKSVNKSFLDNKFQFIHLSFQSFFAARYFVRIINYKNIEEAWELLSRYKSKHQYFMVWEFLPELLEPKYVNKFFCIFFTDINNKENDITEMLLLAISCFNNAHQYLEEKFKESLIKTICKFILKIFVFGESSHWLTRRIISYLQRFPDSLKTIRLGDFLINFLKKNSLANYEESRIILLLGYCKLDSVELFLFKRLQNLMRDTDCISKEIHCLAALLRLVGLDNLSSKLGKSNFTNLELLLTGMQHQYGIEREKSFILAKEFYCKVQKIKSPLEVLATYQLAYLAEVEGKYEEARKYYEQVVYRTTDLVVYHKCADLCKNENAKRAFQYYKKAFDLGDNDAGFKLFLLFKENGHIQEMQDLKGKILNDVWYQTQEVFFYLHGLNDYMQNYEKALELCLSILSCFPEFIAAYVNIALIYLLKGDGEYDKAIEWLDKGMKKDPIRPYFYIFKGIALFLKEVTRISSNFKEVLELYINAKKKSKKERNTKKAKQCEVISNTKKRYCLLPLIC